MKLIALTGGIACGKSTVTVEISKQPNVVIIDVDQIARQALDKDSEPYKQLKKYLESDKAYAGKVNDVFRLGEDYAEDLRGTVNRELLGSLVFKDASLRKALNKFTHPWVFKKMIGKIWEEWKSSSLFDDKAVVLDMPLYFETKMFSWIVSKVIVVTTTPEIQKRFLMQRNNLSEEEAQNRINSQMPNEKKEQMADFVIRNVSDLEHLRKEAIEKFIECKNAASPFGWNTLKISSIIAAASLSAFYAYSHL